MHEFWFTPKLTGYGAVPSTWEGYTLVGAFLTIIMVCVSVMIRRAKSYTAIFPLPMRVLAVSTVVFLIICAWKTDGHGAR
ncbi:hypothetical protein [Rhodopseudomonas sp. B29]|uniref:hypothetical protein n=1 Tax=Rhodopseudomonas sp. B29 TaxID=95607 RepID=UPI0003B3940F|nr:hypothetical protein [Rhodopseudomonas sp. B29]